MRTPDLLATGTCVVVAHQDGDATYRAGAAEQRSYIFAGLGPRRRPRAAG